MAPIFKEPIETLAVKLNTHPSAKSSPGAKGVPPSRLKPVDNTTFGPMTVQTPSALVLANITAAVDANMLFLLNFLEYFFVDLT
ncbi:hypothetical protein [Candidatus Rickettsia colombianensi]|uniref:hypothetical protein n=1 Tax=Candidatus Rickettsia colombianensi TaxID=1090944 RepID=UPI000EF27FF5|nr:hypothetical protein [Candidatus Rickettsia colombianensi]